MRTGAAPGHLRVQGAGFRRPRHYDHLHAGIVESLRQYADVHHELHDPGLEVGENLAPPVLRRLAAQPSGLVRAVAVYDLTQAFGLLHGSREHDCPPLAAYLHGRDGHALQVVFLFHDLGKLALVQVARRGADVREVHAFDRDHLLVDGHEPSLVDRVQNLVVERHSVEHLAQRLFVRAVGRGRDAKNLAVRVLAVVVYHSPVGRRSRMVRLVDHDKPEVARQELRHSPAAVAAGTLRLDRGDDVRRRRSEPSVCVKVAHFDSAVKPRDSLDLLRRLKDKLFAVRDDD